MFKFIQSILVPIIILMALNAYVNCYDNRNRAAEGLFGGALGGALIGGLAGGGKGAGIGAAVGAGVGLMAGSAADQRAQDDFGNEYNQGNEYYLYGRVNRRKIFYEYDEYGYPMYFYFNRRGQRVYIDLN